MSTAVIWVAHHQAKISQSSYAALAVAKQCADHIVAWVIGPASVAATVQQWQGVDQVVHAKAADLVAIEQQAAWCGLHETANYYIAGVSRDVNALWPRFAAHLKKPMITAITACLPDGSFQRFSYAGQIIETVTPNTDGLLLTVQAHAFPEKPNLTKALAPIMMQDLPAKSRVGQQLTLRLPALTSAPLSESKRVVGGGRGVNDFTKLVDFSKTIGAAIGATRAVVDAGTVPNDCQIGQTGVKISPDIYFAFGISGAMQHCAGIQDARVIVAINQDADAPIFQVADITWVEDWQIALNALTCIWPVEGHSDTLDVNQ